VTFNVLDLFSGLGGFSLGLERTGGFKTVAFCEIEEFPRRVLAKHWPEIPIYEDVRTLTVDRLRADGIAVDVICGGFPCQDISLAGKGAGLAGERSGLWSEYARLIGELRPRYVIVENVAALLSRGLGAVLGDLAALGFDAEWHCIPASAVGAPHRRDRLWIVAYPGSEQHEGRGLTIRRAATARLYEADILADASGERCREARELRCDEPAKRIAGSGEDVADADSIDRRAREGQGRGSNIIDRSETCDGSWWLSEPDVGRVAHGIPDRSHRLKGLGNAVVPQIPQLIGQAILAAEAV
jgi:DNA (cytosine-5)-methyltransferase 1